ncbi:MAG: pilin [Candidatus Peribacteria bacterium]|nr:pilin [Candidatus Peribacteria bacterium]
MFIGFLSLQTYAQFGNTDYVSGIEGIPGTQDGLQGSKLLDIIKNFINWMLGMLATIALALCLYAGFLMTTAAGDDGKYKKGFTILKQAGIGLVIVGLSR